MSSEKRRRARVQGGWASSANTSVSKPKGKVTGPVATARSDANKKPMPPAPAWLGQNADGKAEEAKKFVFEEPEQPLKEAAKIQVINKPGLYNISTEPTGISRLRFFPEFIEADECEYMYEELFHELPWKQQEDKRDGKSYMQPRLTAWISEYPYSYAGVTHKANPNWPPAVSVIRARLEEATGYVFNSMAANLYRDGHDHIPWHSENEQPMGPEPVIASLSFGDTRNFELRKKPPKEENGDYTYTEHYRLPLAQGSLLIMEGATQHDWQHRVPREYHDRSGRINLTFRVMFPT